MAVRMKDVAKHAGVSIATVSNVITKKKYVCDEVKERVEKSIADLGYKVNLIARGLKSNKTYTIGVILPDITMMFFADVLKGMGDAARKEKYNVNFLSTEYSFESEKNYVEQLKTERVDGIIIDSCCNYKEQKEWEKEIALSKNGNHEFPVVSIEQAGTSEFISSVAVDNYLATKNCVEHLVAIGRENIIYIAPPLNIKLGHERLKGFKAGLIEAKLPYKEKNILKGDFSTETSYNVIKNAMAKNMNFDGVIAANDHSAIGALMALKEEGKKIPQDVAIIGFDNLFPGTLVSPQISTINIPRYQMGYRACELLIEKINNVMCKPTKIILDTQFIERQSTNEHKELDKSLYKW